MVSLDNPVQQLGGQLVSKILGSILWLGIGAIVIAVIGSLIYYFLVYRKKFDITVKIRSERAEDDKIYFDEAAILYDRKDKIKYFRLFNTRVDLPVPPFQVIQKTNKGDYMEIWRRGEDEFVYLLPGTIDKLNIVKADGKTYKIGQEQQKQLDGDITFWVLQRLERNKALFNNDSWIMKVLPFLPQIIGGILIIFVLYILMDSLPTILNNLKDLTAELKSLKSADVTVHGIIPLLGYKYGSYFRNN